MIWRRLLDAILPPAADRLRLARAYRNVAASEDGAIVLADLLKLAQVDDDPHVPDASHETAYRCGMRRVGLRIKSFAERPLKQFAQARRDYDEDDDDDLEDLQNVA